MSNKRNIIATVFSVLAVISLILVTFEVLNYVEFYKAVERFQVELENVAIDSSRINEGEILVEVQLKATNPTGFVGLEISSVLCHLTYVKGGAPQFLAGLSRALSPPMAAGPSQATILELDFDLKHIGEENLVRDFIGYLQKNPERIDWIITGRTAIKAYTNIFEIIIGPFEYSTNLTQSV
jgi:hypothetical protein